MTIKLKDYRNNQALRKKISEGWQKILDRVVNGEEDYSGLDGVLVGHPRRCGLGGCVVGHEDDPE
ncbi:MAG: hypothetical protein WC457_04185 [Patescibacteria group bacterium]